MLKKTITYTDYNGNQQTEDFYFNLNKAEITEMELEITGGLTSMLENIIKTRDIPSIVKIFKQFLLKAYGVKSPDGKRFIKSDELSTAFSQTEAYSELYMSLINDEVEAANFVNKLIPSDLAEAINKNKSNDPSEANLISTLPEA